MKVFERAGIDFQPDITEHEEAGRFMPVTQVTNSSEVRGVMGNVSALLHLDGKKDALLAVQYCASELIRNVIEHSGSKEGAFVSAQRYKKPNRVTIAVADCGFGIADHLAANYPEARDDNAKALQLAMTPGITGAVAGTYGSPDNAGAGLFITRAMAKVTGGYFFLASGSAAYRLRRGLKGKRLDGIFIDPFAEPRRDVWQFGHVAWRGTLVSMEIVTDKISNFDQFFAWVRQQLPPRRSPARSTRFT
jgi:anti-sigma regulatory factor (Ser/Thr protein kinase)